MDTTSRPRLMQELARRHPILFAVQTFLLYLGVAGLAGYFRIPWLGNESGGLATNDIVVGAFVGIVLTVLSRQLPAGPPARPASE